MIETPPQQGELVSKGDIPANGVWVAASRHRCSSLRLGFGPMRALGSWENRNVRVRRKEYGLSRAHYGDIFVIFAERVGDDSNVARGAKRARGTVDMHPDGNTVSPCQGDFVFFFPCLLHCLWQARHAGRSKRRDRVRLGSRSFFCMKDDARLCRARRPSRVRRWGAHRGKHARRGDN